jgi:NADH-quinone oxidoreductase subunit C/D
MFNWKEFEKSKNILSHVGGNCYKAELGQHHLYVRPNVLLDWIEFIKDDLGFFSMSEIVAFDRSGEKYDFEIVYNLLNMGSHQRLNLHLLLNQGEIIPSVVTSFPHADWMEREQAEMLNLSFDRKSDSLILPAGQKNFPLRKNAKISSWPEEEISELPQLRFNPNKSEDPYPEEHYLWKAYDLFSPQTLGNFEWQVCFDPTKVVDSHLRIGLHHQGIEYLFQKKDIIQILHLTDKINLSSAPSYSIAWARTVEDMFRIKIPERAQAIRIVLLELARISDHLTVLAMICKYTSNTESQLFINAREKILELFEKYAGHRHGLGVVKIGGLKEDLPHGWIVEYQNVMDVLRKNLRIIHKSLVFNHQFRSILEGEAVNAQSVIQWGITGPAMRAAGLNFDLRKSQPFYFYQDIDFDIPVGIHGSSYDRYLIRYEEIHQSLRIINQVIDNLPLGEVILTDFDKNYLEIFKVFETLEKPTEWHYSSIESPSGEAGFLVKFEKELSPARIKIKTPGFALAQAIPVFAKGLKESQLGAGLASLGISRWEMDR